MLTENRDPAMGNLGYERIENDFYPTPDWCTDALLDELRYQDIMPSRTWEPACGDGAIALRLQRAGVTVLSTDLIDRGFGTGGQDFMATWEAPGGVEAIVTNPPYGIAEEFVRHALLLMRPVNGQVWMLLRNEFDCAAGRTDLFTTLPFATKIVLTKRPKWIRGSTGSPRHNYAWYGWRWGHNSAPTIAYRQ